MKTLKFSTKLDRVTVCIGSTPVVLHAAVEVQITKPANLSKLDEQAWALLEKHRKSDSEAVHISTYSIPLGAAQEG